jgi:cysteine-rich repeat protein
MTTATPSSGDGCTAFCDLEPGEPVCGNGIDEGTEQCDDGNTVSGERVTKFCDFKGPGYAGPFESFQISATNEH